MASGREPPWRLLFLEWVPRAAINHPAPQGASTTPLPRKAVARTPRWGVASRANVAVRGGGHTAPTVTRSRGSAGIPSRPPRPHTHATTPTTPTPPRDTPSRETQPVSAIERRVSSVSHRVAPSLGGPTATHQQRVVAPRSRTDARPHGRAPAPTSPSTRTRREPSRPPPRRSTGGTSPSAPSSTRVAPPTSPRGPVRGTASSGRQREAATRRAVGPLASRGMGALPPVAPERRVTAVGGKGF